MRELRRRSEFAARYEGRVRRHAFRLARRLPSHIGVEDLIAAGNLGLADAINRWSGESSERFEAYADFRIRGAMMDELRGQDPLSRDLRDWQKRLVAMVRSLTNELGRPPEEIEIAHRLRLPLSRFREILTRLAAGFLVSLDTTAGGEGRALELESPDEPVDSQAMWSERRNKLTGFLRELPERLQSVLHLYYVRGCSLGEIGRELCVSESRVCQLHAEALVRLRAAYAAAHDHDEDQMGVDRPQGKETTVGRRAVCRAG
jgi:RNA polymerase sigma factor for flagellar operon FliA